MKRKKHSELQSLEFDAVFFWKACLFFLFIAPSAAVEDPWRSSRADQETSSSSPRSMVHLLTTALSDQNTKRTVVHRQPPSMEVPEAGDHRRKNLFEEAHLFLSIILFWPDGFPPCRICPDKRISSAVAVVDAAVVAAAVAVDLLQSLSHLLLSSDRDFLSQRR